MIIKYIKNGEIKEKNNVLAVTKENNKYLVIVQNEYNFYISCDEFLGVYYSKM